MPSEPDVPKFAAIKCFSKRMLLEPDVLKSAAIGCLSKWMFLTGQSWKLVEPAALGTACSQVDSDGMQS